MRGATFGLLALHLTLAAQKPSQAREAAADQVAFQAVCGSCHKTDLISGLRTESEWLEVIEQMVKIGAKGTDEQFDRVIRVLLTNYTKVNVNIAPAAEIAPVLGVSDAVAESIVAWRSEKGRFAGLEQLRQVPGIDRSQLEQRKGRIAF
jgi:competence ComEA-like helix-hairpin-helix protein